MTKNKIFSHEQIQEANKLFTIINSIEPEKRKLAVALASAYMEGIKAESILAEAKNKEIEC